MQRTEMMKKTAQNKGLAALGSGAATALAAGLMTPWLLLLGAPITLLLIFRWLQYRAKWGMRF